jgi:hypothetical protein
VNSPDILKYGHRTLMHEIEGIDEWDTPGVVGTWTAKDLLAHLASYEHLIAEVLHSLLDAKSDSPTIQQMGELGHDAFNDAIVAASRDKSLAQVRADYDSAHEQVKTFGGQVSAETLRQPGTIPWYGTDYSVDDFIVYTQYGHKREHSAQFAAFKDQMKRR